MLSLLIPLILLTGCQQAVKSPQPPPVLVAEPAPETQAPQPTPGEYPKLSWEHTTEPKPFRKPWSMALIDLIRADFATYSKAKDLTQICPKWESLKREDQEKALAEFVVALIYYESGYSPVKWMTETTMGTDPVTGKQVKSEGLMQLSYQDVRSYPSIKNCGIDWQKDKSRDQNDPKKTIFDPFVNLTCGMGIMKNQIEKRGEYLLSMGVYWAVIKEGGKYTQIPGILARVKKNSKCG